MLKYTLIAASFLGIYMITPIASAAQKCPGMKISGSGECVSKKTKMPTERTKKTGSATTNADTKK